MNEGFDDEATTSPSCPICFESSSSSASLVAGSCGHGVCLECASQLFLEGRARGVGGGKALEFIPTLGKCPLCRKVLLYVDLKYLATLQEAFSGDPVDEMVLDSVYAGTMGVGWASLHLFEKQEEEQEEPAEGGSAQKHQVSYILKDDTRVPLIDPKYHHGTKTMTFRIWSPDGGGEGMAVFSFSDNYSFISRGLLRLTFPIRKSKFDGIWKRSNNGTRLMIFNRQCVLYDSDDGCCFGKFRIVEENILALLVRREALSEYPEFGTEGSIPMDELWTAHIVDNCNASSSPSQPDDLPLGTRLCWKRNSSNLVHDEWILDANRELPSYVRSESKNAVIPVPISGRDGQLYWRLDAPGPPPPVYNENALAGNVFVQSGTIGLASYHFEETEIEGSLQFRPYISYEHAYAATKWPPLDNGRPIPSRMYFTNVETDGATLFRGTIDWMGTHGTTWSNGTCWTYEIQFDARFQCVIGGSVRFEQDGSVQVLSEFGRDLVYINAAVFSDKAVRRQFSVRHFRSVGATEPTTALLQETLQRPAKLHSFLS